MTKEEIIKTIWNELPNITVKEARKLYETTIDLIKDRLSKGEEIHLRGFGIFGLREKSKRMGRNPRTGKEAEIKERKVVAFKPSKVLKDMVSDEHKPFALLSLYIDTSMNISYFYYS